MGSKLHSEIIHLDKANKQIFLKDLKEVFVSDYPELHGSKITQNQLMSFMLKKVLDTYVLKNYYELYSNYSK